MRKRIQNASIGLALIMLLPACGGIARSQEQDEQPHPVSISPCGGSIDILMEGYRSLDELAWGSHQVVIGTIAEVLPPAWSDPIAPDLDASARWIFTDYLVKVETRIRGVDVPLIRVRQMGGKIGDCVMGEENVPLKLFEPGTRLLLFLVADDSQLEASERPYFLTGGIQGYWSVVGEDAVKRPEPVYAGDKPQSLVSMVEQIDRSLRSGNPPSQMSPSLVVGLPEAPVAPEPPVIATEAP